MLASTVRMKLGAAAVLLVVGLLVLGTASKPVQAGFPGSNGKIAFARTLGGNYEIFTMNADGTGGTNLTTNSVNDEEPDWSPTGKKIAFARTLGGDYEIYKMNADGTSVQNVTNNAAIDSYPAWSPNGKKIAFLSERDRANFEIYKMNPDGTSVRRLTDNHSPEQRPAWQPLP